MADEKLTVPSAECVRVELEANEARVKALRALRRTAEGVAAMSPENRGAGLTDVPSPGTITHEIGTEIVRRRHLRALLAAVEKLGA